jgi:Helix-turn-helix domain
VNKLDPQERARFLADLQATWRQAGSPTYREIERASGGRCSASTISRIFTGRTLPRWTKVEALLEVLAQLGGLAELGDASRMSWWQDRYDGITDGRASDGSAGASGPPPAESAGPGGRPPGMECPNCGSWVTNPRRHGAWHEGIEQASAPFGTRRPASWRPPDRQLRSGVTGLADPNGPGRVVPLPGRTPGAQVM